jgi:hypothetical protein
MRDLTVGDALLAVDAAGALVYSEPWVFGHFVTSGLFPFKRLFAASGANITASPDHYMLVGRGAGAGEWARRAAVPARDVRVGDVLWVTAGTGAGAKLEPSPVVGVADVMEEGIVNPLTLTGTVVVDGVAASVCEFGFSFYRSVEIRYKSLTEHSLHSNCRQRHVWLRGAHARVLRDRPRALAPRAVGAAGAPRRGVVAGDCVQHRPRRARRARRGAQHRVRGLLQVT